MAYHSVLDTDYWTDEDPNCSCSSCMNVLQLLWLRRRTLWGDAPTEYENLEVWETVQREFPAWPGFARVTRPEGLPRKRDRAAGLKLIKSLIRTLAGRE